VKSGDGRFIITRMFILAHHDCNLPINHRNRNFGRNGMVENEMLYAQYNFFIAVFEIIKNKGI
jgi:hypothetical protein